jgi:hypothetical protein
MARYHELSIVQKRTEAIARVHEAPLVCPGCDAKVMPDDLLRHVDERCAGGGEPGERAKWVPWGEVLKLGVAPQTVHYWVQTGRVRWRGERLDRTYLLRDLVLIIAIRKLRQRRKSQDSDSKEG